MTARWQVEGLCAKTRDFLVAPGTSIGYLPDDFHSVTSVGDGPGLVLHFYGRGLDTITDRIVFEGPEGGAYEPFLMSSELFLPLPEMGVCEVERQGTEGEDGVVTVAAPISRGQLYRR